MKYPKLLGSSVNPNELSMTIKGILLGLIPLAVVIFTSTGIDITSGELTEVVNAIVAVLSTVLTVVGLIRKLVVANTK